MLKNPNELSIKRILTEYTMITKQPQILMQFRIILFLLVAALATSCAQPEKQDSDNDLIYCYIDGVWADGADHVAGIVFIDFLSGDEAIEAARRAGDAIEEEDEDGNTVYSVPNDYYIQVSDETVHELRFHPNVVAKSWAYAEDYGMTVVDHYDIVDFIRLQVGKNAEFEFVPFRIRIDKDRITYIEEQYIP